MNKVSKESIENKIVDKIFKKLSGKLTHCTLILENGFEVTGESACVDPANYDKVIGEQIAYENAFEKIWAVEGYLLQEELYRKTRNGKKYKHYILLDNETAIRFNDLTPEIVSWFLDEALSHARLHKKDTRAFYLESITLMISKFVENIVYSENYKIDNFICDIYDIGYIFHKSAFTKKNIILNKMKKVEEDRFIMEGIIKPSSKYPVTLEQAFLHDRAIANKNPYGGQLTNNEFNDYVNDLRNPSLNQNYKYNLIENNVTFSDGTVIKFDKMSSNIAHQIFDELLKEKGFGSYTIRKMMFEKIFPEATANDFMLLANGKSLIEEISFMEKYEKIMEPVPTNGSDWNIMQIDNKRNIQFNKLCRQELDIIIQELKESKRKSPERSTAIRKAIEATMWLGMDLKAIGTPNPYPQSKNPNNTTVEPTADGLKL